MEDHQEKSFISPCCSICLSRLNLHLRSNDCENENQSTKTDTLFRILGQLGPVLLASIDNVNDDLALKSITYCEPCWEVLGEAQTVLNELTELEKRIESIRVSLIKQLCDSYATLKGGANPVSNSSSDGGQGFAWSASDASSAGFITQIVQNLPHQSSESVVSPTSPNCPSSAKNPTKKKQDPCSAYIKLVRLGKTKLPVKVKIEGDFSDTNSGYSIADSCDHFLNEMQQHDSVSETETKPSHSSSTDGQNGIVKDPLIKAMDDHSTRGTEHKHTIPSESRIISKDKPFRMFSCRICGKMTTTKRRLRSHLQTVHNIAVAKRTEHSDMIVVNGSSPAAAQAQLTCKHSLCYFHTSIAEELKMHIKEVHTVIDPKLTERPFVCSTCGWNFKLKQHIKSHVQRVHNLSFQEEIRYNDVPESNELKKEEPDDFPNMISSLVPTCDEDMMGNEEGNSRSVDEKSSASHKPEEINKSYKCDVCEVKFKRKDGLKRHQADIHGIIIVGKKRHPCPRAGCKQVFSHGRTLKAHLRKAHNAGELPFKCSECGKMFKQEPALKLHWNSHFNIRPYMCEICSSTFTRIQYLRAHQRSHPELNLKPIKCEVCNKEFTTPAYLNVHRKLLHQNQFKYQCEICGYKAYYECLLKVHHQKVHLKEQTEECEYCHKKFPAKDKLKIHIRSAHTGEKPYVCKTCGKGFFAPNYLKRHNEIHVNDLKHVCEVCGKKFPLHNYLYIHMKSHNKQMKVANSEVKEDSEIPTLS